MGGVSGGERVGGRLHRGRPAGASVSAFASCDLRKRGHTWRGRRGRGGALAQPHGAAQHAFQGSEARRWRLVQVAVVAARAGTASRRGATSDSDPVDQRRGDVDVHLAFNHSFGPAGYLLIILLLFLLVLFFIIIVIIILLCEEKYRKNEAETIKGKIFLYIYSIKHILNINLTKKSFFNQF